VHQKDIRKQTSAFCETYNAEVSKDMLQDIDNIYKHPRNEPRTKTFTFASTTEVPLRNEFRKCIEGRIFCTLPTGIAEAEKPFSMLCRMRLALQIDDTAFRYIDAIIC
jgi:hypothetical protein